MVEESIDDSTGSEMDKILARRFSPFNFSIVPGFPNVVPTVDEWVDFFPIFKEHKEDNPAQASL
jgi:hypothetical protein